MAAALLLEVGTGLKVPEVWAEGLFFCCFYLPSEKLSKTQNSPVDPAKREESKGGIVVGKGNNGLRRLLCDDTAWYGVNWYAYAGNNPLRFTDPTGLWVWGVAIGFFSSSFSEVKARMPSTKGDVLKAVQQKNSFAGAYTRYWSLYRGWCSDFWGFISHEVRGGYSRNSRGDHWRNWKCGWQRDHEDINQ